MTARASAKRVAPGSGPQKCGAALKRAKYFGLSGLHRVLVYLTFEINNAEGVGQFQPRVRAKREPWVDIERKIETLKGFKYAHA
jgi:hypothetical protein